MELDCEKIRKLKFDDLEDREQVFTVVYSGCFPIENTLPDILTVRKERDYIALESLKRLPRGMAHVEEVHSFLKNTYVEEIDRGHNCMFLPVSFIEKEIFMAKLTGDFFSVRMEIANVYLKYWNLV